MHAFNAFAHFLVLVVLPAKLAAFVERRRAEVQHVQVVHRNARVQALKRIGGVVIVAIQEHDELAGGHGHARVARGGQAGVAL